jgi:hypothetical protein
MPKGPKGEKRPADVIANAVKVMRIATGEEPEDYDTPEKSGKDPAAVSTFGALSQFGSLYRDCALECNGSREAWQC